METVSFTVAVTGPDADKPTDTGFVVLESRDAWALAQFLKRLTFDQARACSVDADEAYRIINASEGLRGALARAGCAPR